MPLTGIQLAILRVRVLAGGAALVLIGAVYFMATADMDNQSDRLAWAWFSMALGFAGILVSRLVARRSMLVKVVLWTGIVIFVASIFALRIALTVAP